MVVLKQTRARRSPHAEPLVRMVPGLPNLRRLGLHHPAVPLQPRPLLLAAPGMGRAPANPSTPPTQLTPGRSAPSQTDRPTVLVSVVPVVGGLLLLVLPVRVAELGRRDRRRPPRSRRLDRP